MENDFDDFIKNIMKIENQLNLLYGKSEDLVENMIKKIEKLNITDKDTLINKYENFLIEMTHETGTNIGFYRNDICKLNKYINFRIKYNSFSEEIIGKMIDDKLTLIEKKELSEDNKDIIKIIGEIKQNWNKTFENISYKKFMEKMGIN